MLQGHFSKVPTVILYTCAKKFCPTCVRQWSAELTARLMPRAASAGASRLRHIVLTIRNVRAGELAQALDQMQTAFREWRNQGRRRGWWRPEGYVSKIELERAPRAKLKWHPHIHILLDIGPESRGFEFTRASDARGTWERLTEKHTGHAAVANWITRPRSSNMAAEVSKYCAKPLQLATMNVDDLCEVAAAFHRRRILTSYGSLAGCDDLDPEPSTYLGHLSTIVAEHRRFEAEGWDVSAILLEFERRFGSDPRLRERMPLLKHLHDGE